MLDLYIFLFRLDVFFFYWRKQSCSNLARSNSLKLKTDEYVYYKHADFVSQDVNQWIRVVWIIVMFLSAVWTLSLWRHPFTAEDPLVSKWYNAKFLNFLCKFYWLGYLPKIKCSSKMLGDLLWLRVDVVKQGASLPIWVESLQEMSIPVPNL